MPDRPLQLEQIANYRHGRVPRELRERQLLALAEDLFAERGYQRSSMDELARRAGVSKPLIYELFASKEDLHRVLFQRAADELAASVSAAIATAPDNDLEGALRAGAVAFFRFIEAHRAAWTMLFSDEDGSAHAPHLNDIRARQTGLVVNWLEAAAARGAEIDPRRLQAAGHTLNGAYEWLAAWWRFHPDVPATTLADWLVELMLPGLAKLLRLDAIADL